MTDGFNYLMIAVFLGLAGYMGYRHFTNMKKVLIKDRQQKSIRILVVVMGFLVASATILNISRNTVFDYTRTILLVFVIAFFYAMHDGIGNEGVVAYSRFYAYRDIVAYDYIKDNETTTIFIETEGNKKDIKRVVFNASDSEGVLKLLKDNIGKKYKRMKKN